VPFLTAADEDHSFYIGKMVVFVDRWGELNDSRKERFWKILKGLLKIGALASKNPRDKQILEYLKSHPKLL